MRFRTLALALALSCGATSLVQAAPKKTSVKRVKRQKLKKVKPDKRFKQTKAAKVKPHKARKVKHA
jgi:cytochrome c556